MGTGNEHHVNGVLDDNRNSRAVKDEFVLRRKTIAAVVMGAATAQFSASKVCRRVKTGASFLAASSNNHQLLQCRPLL